MLKIHINRIPASLNCEVYIIEEFPTVTHSYTFSPDGICTIHTEAYKPGEASTLKPSMIIEERFLRNMVTAFAEYAKKESYPIHEDATKGKLEATEKHLEDMRTLVFKKNETN